MSLAPELRALADDLEVRLRMTCASCPTQFDVHFTDGRYGYFRYRGGRWSFSLYPVQAAFWDGPPVVAVGGDFREERGDLDGSLEDAEVAELLAGAIPETLRMWEEMP